METPRGINDHDIDMAALCRLQTIEDHRPGVGTRLMADNIRPHALPQYLKLVDGCRSEGVGGSHDHPLSLLFERVGQLGNA